MAPPRSRPGLDHLAPRQREALALLARGASVRETARAMGVSPETVKTHRRAVYRRLGVAGRVGALIRLYEARLAEVEALRRQSRRAALRVKTAAATTVADFQAVLLEHLADEHAERAEEEAAG